MKKAKLSDLLTEEQSKKIILKLVSVDTMVRDLTVRELHVISPIVLLGKNTGNTLASQTLDYLAQTAHLKNIPIF